MSRTIAKGLKTDAPAQLELNADLYLEGDQYIAACVELDTIGQGDTRQEAIEVLKEVTESFLQSFPEALETPEPSSIPYPERVRRMEGAYSEMIGEPIEPVNVEALGHIKFVIDYPYA